MISDQIDNIIFVFDDKDRFRKSPPIFIGMAKRISGFNQNITIEEAKMAKEDQKLRVDWTRWNFRGATCQTNGTERVQEMMARRNAQR